MELEVDVSGYVSYVLDQIPPEQLMASTDSNSSWTLPCHWLVLNMWSFRSPTIGWLVANACDGPQLTFLCVGARRNAHATVSVAQLSLRRNDSIYYYYSWSVHKSTGTVLWLTCGDSNKLSNWIVGFCGLLWLVKTVSCCNTINSDLWHARMCVTCLCLYE